MNPTKVIREKVVKLTDLPNIGKTVAADLKSIGITQPDQLSGQNPYDLYVRLCEAFGEKQDPCMLDVLMSITDFMDGGEARVWWDYTPERKMRYGSGTIER
ncbi:MAG: TfoX/Sxy family DNA transformation protein [Campylobacterales bacterium]|nr:TfoX/Sxy family DNA transformation protein [Campylobacterales bacterium]